MKSRDQYGQALVEMLVVAPLILAIAAGIMAIGMYMQAKTTTIGAARYSVWERAVWADPERPWNGEHNHGLGGSSSTVIRTEYDIAHSGLAYLTNPSLRIRSDRNISRVASFDGSDYDNPEVLSWGGSTHSGYRTLGGNVGAFVAGAREASDLSAWQQINSRYVYEMTYEEQGDDIILPSHELQDFGIEPLVNRGLKLPTESVVSAKVTLALPNVFHAAWSLGWLTFDDVAGDSEMRIASSASLLTNSWAPKNEEVYTHKVHGLDVKPLTDYITAANQGIASGIESRMGAQADLLTWIPILGDVLLAGNPVLDSSSTVLPFTRIIPSVDAHKPEPRPLKCSDPLLC